MSDEKLPLTTHLEELRKRLIISLIAIGAGFVCAYFFAAELFQILSRPLQTILPEGNSFIFTGVAEGFFTYLKVAFFGGLFLACPVILFQIWRFVAPGLYSHEKNYALPFVMLSSLCFAGGTLFGYLYVLPIAFKFFLGFNTAGIKMMPSMREYLSFSCKFLLAFGLVFELPVFILFLSKLGLVTDRQLRANRRFVLVGVFAVSAFLTPPDVVSQILMAVPLIVLYEISIMVARVFGSKPDEENDRDEPEAGDEEEAPPQE